MSDKDDDNLVLNISDKEIELTLSEAADLLEVLTAYFCEVFRGQGKEDDSDLFSEYEMLSTEVQ